jgi:hypothetical protein
MSAWSRLAIARSASVIAAIAASTDANGNTSEFALNIMVGDPSPNGVYLPLIRR